MKKIPTLLLLLIFVISCSFKKDINKDPLEKEFYNKTRFIMTKEEKDIYKHLADKESKEQFIKDFWIKRDPTPETEENENKIEYEKRVDFANKNFRDKKIKEKGWDSDRGRILLLLGFPNQITPIVTTYKGTTKQVQLEIWHYYKYRLKLIFIDKDGFGQYRLDYWPSRLHSYIEKAKNIFNIYDKKYLTKKFKFNLDYKEKKIIIKIPVKNIQFEEIKNKFKAEFKINIYIYKNYKKIKTLTENKIITKSKEDFLNKKTINISIHFTPKEKGIYYLEAIIEEISTSTRYRVFHKIKR